jgi:hypothetical protein
MPQVGGVIVSGLPQPDLMLLKPRADRYSSSLPSAADVFVLIAVSDKTLEYDRGLKLSLYAQHGLQSIGS